MPDVPSPIDAWRLLQNLAAYGGSGTEVVQAIVVSQAAINQSRRVGKLALFNPNGSPFTGGGGGGGGGSYDGLGTYLFLNIGATLPAVPQDSVFVLNDTAAGGIHKIMLVNDSFNQPILWLQNEGGLKVSDVITFIRGNDLKPMVRLGWLNESTNKGPAIIFSYIGSGGTIVSDDQGNNVTIDAGKDAHIAITSDAAFRFSKNIRTAFGTGGVTNTGAVGPGLEPGFSAATYLGTGGVVWYRSAADTWRTPDAVICDTTVTAGSFIGPTTLLTNSQTGLTYTFVLADNGKVVEMNNASANTLTVPTDASVPYAVGSQILVRQVGAGQTTIAAASGVTLRARVGLKLAGQWAECVLTKRATNEWVVVGDVSA